MKFTPRPVDARAAWALQQAGVHPLLAQLYAARGVRSASQLDERLGALLAPSQLLHAERAAQLLADAIAARERLLVVADYDCDGATACAVALRGLRMLGAEVGYLVPDRFAFGYGLSPAIVELAAQRTPRPDWLITVDNGIASIEGVQRATALGLRVLVTDHHLPGAQLPDAACIVNPNQPGCPFPSKALAGCGVMFYVLLALRAELRARGVFGADDQPRLDALLDLVALGTVADVVPLDANNRALVAQGLKRIRAGRLQPGVRALFDAAQRDPATAGTFDLAFGLAPRLNAAGRLADMSLGIECLASDDAARAAGLAHQLDAINRERKAVQQGMHDDALQAIGTLDPAAAAVVLFDARWHEGVVGIVAGRIKDQLHRPAFVFAPAQDGMLKGSGRSIAGFHLRDALDLVAKRESGLLLRFGGHAMAAGATLVPDGVERFRAALEQVAREWLTPAQLTRTLEVDGPLPGDAWQLATARLIDSQVWGQGFAAPLFCDDARVVSQRLIGSGHSALKLQVNGSARDAVWWGHTEPLPAQLRVAYRLAINRYQGQEQLRMEIVAAEAA
ncbi:MAG: single-stranded-DNA-specific exonuclease RecJ [Betaproteobacteria bacterium]|nr:single-stranded-DNA-specific exonuclease RecJ [Betaproteobacteria bacterium]